MRRAVLQYCPFWRQLGKLRNRTLVDQTGPAGRFVIIIRNLLGNKLQEAWYSRYHCTKAGTPVSMLVVGW